MKDAIEMAEAADIRSRVNEKLLKALIAILAVKDEHLLDELCVVFEHARKHAVDKGSTSPEVWKAVNKQMDVFKNIACSDDVEELEAEAQKH